MPATSLGARVAVSTRLKGANHPDTLAARQAHAAAAIEDEIERRLAAAPPLSDEQVDRLAALHRGAQR